MAEVTVFVDDAVRGDLPAVCVVDGTHAEWRMMITEEIGGGARSGTLMLLLFLGPFGWFLAALVSLTHRSEFLRVELPYSQAAYERFSAARQLSRRSKQIGVVAVAAMAALAWALQLGTAGVVLVIAAALATGAAAFVARVRMNRESVSVRLDASRRWVRLIHVHPAFADACTSSMENDRTLR